MSEFFSNYYLESSYCSVTSLNVNIGKSIERGREKIYIFQVESRANYYNYERLWHLNCMERSLDASSSMVYAQQDMFMKKLVFNREKFSGSSIVIYASFSHASNLRCSMNIAENYSTCFNANAYVY